MMDGEFPEPYNVPVHNEPENNGYSEYLDDRKAGGKCRVCDQELGAAVICPSCGADNSSTPPFERTIDGSSAKVD